MAAVIHAEQLQRRAEKGESLTTEERRHVIAYLLGKPNEQGRTAVTIPEMAKLFNVTERMISVDKAAIRKQVAEELKNDATDVGLIIADLKMAFDKTIRNVEKSAAAASIGGRTYLDHQLALWKLQNEYITRLQDLGILPKELGNMTVEKYEFTASVGLESKGRPLNTISDKPQTVPAEVVTHKELTDGSNSGTSADTTESNQQYLGQDEINARAVALTTSA